MAEPTAAVLRAFGVPNAMSLFRAVGGRASTWIAGNTVLKHADVPEAALAWQASAFADLTSDQFRLGIPIAASDRRFVVDGWCALPLLVGSPHTGRWEEIAQTGDAFHHAARFVAHPEFLDTRTDAWSIGDRVAWGEMDATELARDTPHLDRLLSCRQPVRGPHQLIHGDLGGNVLFDDLAPPAIIDVTPYWRPPTFATAVIVADALVWEGANKTSIGWAFDIDDFHPTPNPRAHLSNRDRPRRTSERDSRSSPVRPLPDRRRPRLRPLPLDRH
jgi:uncharacterized protein (TIGR02569 family)